MKNDPIRATAGGVPATRREIEQREAFEAKVLAWYRFHQIGLDRDASAEDMKRRSDGMFDIDLAHEIIAFPIPASILLFEKLDLLIHYASKYNEEHDPHERIVLSGLCALRAGVVALGL